MSSGATLLEMMFVVALIGLSAAALSSLLSYFQRGTQSVRYAATRDALIAQLYNFTGSCPVQYQTFLGAATPSQITIGPNTINVQAINNGQYTLSSSELPAAGDPKLLDCIVNGDNTHNTTAVCTARQAGTERVFPITLWDGTATSEAGALAGPSDNPTGADGFASSNASLKPVTYDDQGTRCPAGAPLSARCPFRASAYATVRCANDANTCPPNQVSEIRIYVGVASFDALASGPRKLKSVTRNRVISQPTACVVSGKAITADIDGAPNRVAVFSNATQLGPGMASDLSTTGPKEFLLSSDLTGSAGPSLSLRTTDVVGGSPTFSKFMVTTPVASGQYFLALGQDGSPSPGDTTTGLRLRKEAAPNGNSGFVGLVGRVNVVGGLAVTDGGTTASALTLNANWGSNSGALQVFAGADTVTTTTMPANLTALPVPILARSIRALGSTSKSTVFGALNSSGTEALAINIEGTDTGGVRGRPVFYDYASGSPRAAMALNNGNIIVDPDGINSSTTLGATSRGLLFGGPASSTGIQLNRSASPRQLDFFVESANQAVLTLSQAGQVVVRGGIDPGAQSETGVSPDNHYAFRVDGLDARFARNVYIHGNLRVNGAFSTPSLTDLTVTNLTVTNLTLNTPSDERLKHQIEPIAEAAAGVMALKPVQFRYRAQGSDPVHFGFLAQDVEQVFPNLVGTGAEGMKNLRYLELIAPLVAAAQKHEAEIIELRKQVAACRR